MNPTHRIAAYWTPERDHPLWQAGCDWLGRDPELQDSLQAPRPGAAQCARYGFHATLKAPRALREGIDAPAFVDAVAALARRTACFEMPRLEVVVWRGFVALRSVQALAATHPLRRLADACVHELEPLCAPGRSRTPQPGMDARHEALQRRWGYPFVLDRWEFHLTLSDPVHGGAPAADALASRLARARRHFHSALATPPVCGSVSLFVEPAASAPLLLTQRVPLAR